MVYGSGIPALYATAMISFFCTFWVDKVRHVPRLTVRANWPIAGCVAVALRAAHADATGVC